ncbi:MAG TPA: HAD-IA family hydrolase [Usitatibacteraceae bacterium]|nr:HAD-IA family hydrolase [Usitatibacteraceae bacterium]
MARFDLVVFDWDGTLMDSTALIADCIRQAARETALPVPTPEHARSIIGLGLEDSLARLFPGAPSATLMAFAGRYRHHFVARDHEAPLFDGVHELLDDLHAAQRIVAVATGKSRRGLDRALEATGLRERFHYTRCADEGRPKPDPEMLEYLMTAAGAARERTLMIGDTTHDLDLARNAGVAAVALGHGAHGPEQLQAAAPLALVDNLAQLRAWMQLNG